MRFVPDHVARLSMRFREAEDRLDAMGRTGSGPLTAGFECLWSQSRLTALRARIAEGATEDWRRAAIARADDLLEFGFPLLGWGRVKIDESTTWNCDLRFDVSWPHSYHKLIDTVRAGETCDVKYPWELSRLQLLPVLGQAWTASSNDRYLDRFWAILSGWAAENPVGFGVNWTCSMEVAIRAINIVAATNLFAAGLSVRQRALIAMMLRQHMTHISFNLEMSDVNGNHLLFDRLGLVIVSIALNGPEHARTQRYVALLNQEIREQFHADGVHLEHATSYQRLLLEGVALYLLVLRCRGALEDEQVRNVAASMARFMWSMCGDNGRFPCFGDSDSGNVLVLGGPMGNNATPAIAAAFAAGLLPAEASRVPCDDLAFWLSPAARASSLATVSWRGPNDGRFRLFSFPEGGYFVARSQDLIVVLRAGRAGLKGRGSHDHNDQLSFTMTAFGKPFLVDPGTRTYTESLKSHELDLSSTSHNTVTVRELEQGPIVAGSVTATVRQVESSCEEFRVVRQNGVVWRGHIGAYHDRSSNISHSRSVTILDDGQGSVSIEVADEIRCGEAGVCTGAAVYLLDPEWQAECDVDGSVVLRGRGAEGRLHTTEGQRALRIERRWISREYGSSSETKCVVVEIAGTEVARSVVRIELTTYDSRR
ncbi:MAG: heparinase II/III family protein [Steroidobacteraceae bacterium]